MNKDKKTPSILVIGSLNMDLVMNCDRVPEAGESLMGEKYNYVPGGKGANQAVAAAKMGAEVSFAGKRGADSLGNKLEQNLGKYRINTDFLKVDENHRTGLASIMVDKTGENRILVFPGANMEIQWEEIKPVFKENFDALLLQLEIPEKINIKAVREAKKHDIPVILDTGPAQSFSLEKIKGVKILSPNETEAYSLTGIKINNKKDAEKAARNLAGKSRAEIVIIKMGAEGALLYEKNNTEFFPAFKVEAVDTTAAGDAFMGALSTHYIKTGDIEKSIKYAGAAGACAVTRLGAQTSLPGPEAVESILNGES